MYTIVYPVIYVSRDTASSWDIDTTGLNGAVINDVAVDSNNYAWVAADSGVFYQHADSSVWQKNLSFPGSNPSVIFVDRMNRIFVAANSMIYASTNSGTSWQDITGVNYNQVQSFGDDAFGNIYSTGFYGAYRLSKLNPPWVNISDSIGTFSSTPTNLNFINAISGDTILYAATDFGLFKSSDSGSTWMYEDSSMQMPASTFYGLVRSGNYYLTSTNLGVYRLKDGDSVFTKVFPKKGFKGGIQLWADSAGTIFTLQQDSYTTLTYINRSTDHGTTWTRDTVWDSFNFYNYSVNVGLSVDRQGNQYGWSFWKLYIKIPGHQWMIDTAGLNMSGVDYISSFSDNNPNGIVYVAVNRNYSGFSLFRQTIGDTSWQEVDASPVSQAEARIKSDNDGNIYLVTNKGNIYRYDGSTWTEIPQPPNLGAAYTHQFIVDKNGVLWASFSDALYSYFTTLRGVWFTENDGATWNFTGLDSVTIRMLATHGDSVFALTDHNGEYTFTTSSIVNTVTQRNNAVPGSYRLFQNYPNPFNPTTTIRYQLPAAGHVTLKVYDILGREVATLVNEVQKAGTYSERFDASKLSSGVYIYSIKTGNYFAAKKLLLMK